jgi:hypothetical protein
MSAARLSRRSQFSLPSPPSFRSTKRFLGRNRSESLCIRSPTLGPPSGHDFKRSTEMIPIARACGPIAIRIRRLAYSPEEAAAALGVSRSFFYEHVLRDLPIEPLFKLLDGYKTFSTTPPGRTRRPGCWPSGSRTSACGARLQSARVRRRPDRRVRGTRCERPPGAPELSAPRPGR